MTASDRKIGKPHDPVGDTALDWFTRRQEGSPDIPSERAFEAWLHADPAHAAAYAQVEALWREPAFVVAITHQAPRRRTRRVSVSLLRTAAALALLAVLGAGALRVVGLPLRLPADHATSIGTERVDRLDDGTRLVLDTASAVDVSYSGTQRTVQLREGRVFFSVAPDARPFQVLAGDVAIRDIGTEFSVDRFDGEVRVVVRQGEVALASGDPGTLEQHLRAGEEGGYRNGRVILPAQKIDPQIAFAWLDHRLFFQQRPLAEVVDELRRYHRGWIVIANPTLQGIKVSGGYNLDDPVAAIRDLARLSGASLMRVSDRVLVLR